MCPPSNTDSSALSLDLRGQFIFSMPHLKDDYFAQTLTYICDHTPQGAMGIIINRPMEFNLQELFNHLDIDTVQEAPATPIFSGGPVQTDKGFVLHQSSSHAWSSSYPINDQVSLTSSLDIIKTLAKGELQLPNLIALGYAGWGAGQLEDEIAQNAWLSCPANLDILFTLPASERLQAAASSLGIDLSLLTGLSGRA